MVKIAAIMLYQKIRKNVGQIIGRNIKLKSKHSRFLLDANQRRVNFVIDAKDDKEIEPSVDWSHVYFKANKWRDVDYPTKVLPIVFGNGLLSDKKIKYLKSLRSMDKKVDIVHISRIYEEGPEAEHNIRVFEQLSQLDCRKDLVAMFGKKSLAREDSSRYIDKLRSLGVVCTDKHIHPRELWRRMGAGRIVFLRAGRCLCIPWRMIDLLAMGACIVYDAVPFPQWPVPLKSMENFVECQDNWPINEGDAWDYEAINSAIEMVLRDEELQNRIRGNNAAYFDRYASPEAVANYVLENVSKVVH